MRLRILLFALAATFPVAALARLEFRPVHNGAPLPGSELCFSRIDTKLESPIEKYFHSSPTSCVAADFVLNVPPGKWSYFARNPNGFVSRHRVLFSYAGGPENTYSASEMQMDEAAFVDFSAVQDTLAAGERAFAVVGATGERLQLVLPLLDGEPTVMVPPNAITIPVVARNGVIVRVGIPLRLAPTQLGKARFDDAGRTVIAWAKVDAGTPQQRFKVMRSIAVPEVVLVTAKGEELQPALPIVWGHDIGETVLFFTNVPPGDVRVTLRGDAWTGSTVVASGDGPLTLAPPLVAKPSAVVKVSALVPELPPDACEPVQDAGKTRAPGTSIALLRCPGAIDSAESRDRCSEVATRAAADAEFASLAAGDYVVELRHPPFRSVYQAVSAEPGAVQQVELRVDARLLTGRIVRRGAPVHARLDLERFPSATGNGGEYALPFPDTAVEGRPLRIVACDGSFAYVHVFTTEPLPNAPYDIDIPNSAVAVQVVDAQEKRVDGAKVRYSVLTEKHDRVRWAEVAKVTDGSAKFDPVVAGMPIRFCAYAPGYEQVCSDPLELVRDTARRDLTLRLRKTFSQGGRVVASRALVGGRLYWTAPDGSVTETVNVDADGSFVLHKPHDETERVAVVSFSHPLLLLTPGVANDGGVVLAVPELPVTAVHVTVAATRPAPSLVALHLGGRHVPVDALLYHQGARQQGFLLERSSLVIPDVAVQAPITVTVGPDVTALASRPEAQKFAEPVCALYESRPLAADGSVSFH